MLNDPKVQYFIARMLAYGIAIEYESTNLMLGLVGHLNNCGYDWEAVGDEDGIIINDKTGMPILMIKYSSEILSFNQPYSDFGLETKNAEKIFKILINTAAYITEISGACMPVNQLTGVGEEIITVVQDDDWSI